jgi:hypothetical protein
MEAVSCEPWRRRANGTLAIVADETELLDLDDLGMAAAVLAKLAADVPVPSHDLEDDVLPFALLGDRAWSLFRNFIHAADSPAALGPVLAIRPLIELSILVKWLSIDPDLHRVLWLAESDATELRHAELMSAHLRARGNNPEPPRDPGQQAEKRRFRDEARARLKAAGRNYGTRLMPSVVRMVEEVERAVPGHQIAVRDAYELAYRTFSPWEHTDASSFKSTAERSDGDSWTYLGDRTPFHLEDLRAIATSMYAYVLETILTSTKTGEPLVARAVRDFVTVHWVRSDRVKAALDAPAINEAPERVD